MTAPGRKRRASDERLRGGGRKGGAGREGLHSYKLVPLGPHGLRPAQPWLRARNEGASRSSVSGRGTWWAGDGVLTWAAWWGWGMRDSACECEYECECGCECVLTCSPGHAHPGTFGAETGSGLVRKLVGVRGFEGFHPQGWGRVWVLLARELGAGTGTGLLQPSPALDAGIHPGGCTTGFGGLHSPNHILQGTRLGMQASARGWGWPGPPPQGVPAAQGRG